MIVILGAVVLLTMTNLLVVVVVVVVSIRPDDKLVSCGGWNDTARDTRQICPFGFDGGEGRKSSHIAQELPLLLAQPKKKKKGDLGICALRSGIHRHYYYGVVETEACPVSGVQCPMSKAGCGGAKGRKGGKGEGEVKKKWKKRGERNNKIELTAPAKKAHRSIK
jgi:hypothetical protein